jgi:ribosome-binding factor A
MRFYRAQRVESLIQDQLGQIIIREVDFDGAFVTIMGVDVDKKMEYAKIRVSVLPTEKTEAAMKVLVHDAGYLQHLLLKKINIKPMPRIMFVEDHGPENAAQVEKVFLEHGEVPALSEEEDGEE